VTAMWRIALTLLLSLMMIVGSALTAPVEAQPAISDAPRWSSSWPTRPVALPDVAARLVAAYASKKWGSR